MEISGNFSIRLWRQYVVIAVIVSLLLTSDRKSSRCYRDTERMREAIEEHKERFEAERIERLIEEI